MEDLLGSSSSDSESSSDSDSDSGSDSEANIRTKKAAKLRRRKEKREKRRRKKAGTYEKHARKAGPAKANGNGRSNSNGDNGSGSANTQKQRDLDLDDSEVLLLSDSDEPDVIEITNDSGTPGTTVKRKAANTMAAPPSDLQKRRRRPVPRRSIGGLDDEDEVSCELFVCHFDITTASNVSKTDKVFLQRHESLANHFRNVCKTAGVDYMKCKFYQKSPLAVSGDLLEGAKLLDHKVHTQAASRLHFENGTRVIIIEPRPRPKGPKAGAGGGGAGAAPVEKKPSSVTIQSGSSKGVDVECEMTDTVGSVIKKYREMAKLPPSTKVVLQFDDDDLGTLLFNACRPHSCPDCRLPTADWSRAVISP